MMKNRITIFGTILVVCLLFSGCADKGKEKEPTVTDKPAGVENVTNMDEDNSDTSVNDKKETELPDGTYSVEFNTDSTMFHVSEACDGKGTLTVKNGKMTIHISLASKNIVNLYCGLAEDATKKGAELLMPTEDTVTYSDGLTEVVYGFDVPVPELNQEFDLALVGTKGTWYDHKVKVSNPKPLTE